LIEKLEVHWQRARAGVSGRWQMVRIQRQIRIEAGPEAVWAVLADYGGVDKWMPSVDHAVITTGEAGVGCERACDIQGMGKVHERVLVWDENERFVVELSAMGPMKSAQSDWMLTPQGEGTLVTSVTDVAMRFGPIGVLMARTVVGRQLGKQLEIGLRGLKAYVEREESLSVAEAKTVASA